MPFDVVHGAARPQGAPGGRPQGSTVAGPPSELPRARRPGRLLPLAQLHALLGCPHFSSFLPPSAPCPRRSPCSPHSSLEPASRKVSNESALTSKLSAGFNLLIQCPFSGSILGEDSENHRNDADACTLGKIPKLIAVMQALGSMAELEGGLIPCRPNL